MKTGSIPCKADPVVQKEFLETTLDPVISSAKRNEVGLYFVDAAHFVMGAFLGYLLCQWRVFVRTPSGRKRYNVLGAYHAVTGAMVSVTNTTYINSSRVMALLGKLRLLHPGRNIKIVLDNAAYQRNWLVRWYAALLDIELIFLPSYSPNLNLMERYWKFLKKCLYNQFYENFESFCRAIDECMAKGSNEYRKEMETLLALHFQSCENVQFLAV